MISGFFSCSLAAALLPEEFHTIIYPFIIRILQLPANPGTTMISGFFTLVLSLFFLTDSTVRTRQDGKLVLHFSHYAGHEKLNPDSTFHNFFDEPYRITRLKYYISNVSLIRGATETDVEIPDTYYLVQEGDDSTGTISLSIPPGNYSGISFLLGVDSLHNISGAQTGALDPMNGMFWTWNTGYVIMKLEGQSSASHLPGHLLEYHLGGFRGPYKVDRRIRLAFPNGTEEVVSKKTLGVAVKLDVNSFFSGTNKLPIRDNPACTGPGMLARQYAENYATLFSITSVVNN